MVVVIGQYTGCSTAPLKPLDLQLIHQVQKLAPDALVSFAHLNVSIGAGCHPYLQAPAVKGLEKAIASRLGQRMTVNSSYRTIAQQAVLYNHCQKRRCGISAAAVPGRSGHESGLCIDIEDAQGWRNFLENQSWDWIGSFDPMHYTFIGSSTKNLQALSIKAFQQLYNFNHPSHAIAEDGSMGAKTMNALLSTSINGFSLMPDSYSQRSSTTTVSTVLFPSLREGMQGEKVKLLQQALLKQKIGVDVDGFYGNNTIAAIKKFQKKAGLDTDGVAGIATIKALSLG